MDKKEQNRTSKRDYLTSPETLMDYIKLSNPSIWLIMIGVIVILAGALVWATFGRLPVTVSSTTNVMRGNMTCIIPAGQLNKVSSGMSVYIGDTLGTIDDVKYVPYKVSELEKVYKVNFNDYTLDEDVYLATGKANVADGTYVGEIIVEEIVPVSFITN